MIAVMRVNKILLKQYVVLVYLKLTVVSILQELLIKDNNTNEFRDWAFDQCSFSLKPEKKT